MYNININTNIINNELKTKTVLPAKDVNEEFETETYNPIDENSQSSGRCNIAASSIVGFAGKVGKFAFKAIGGWVGIGITAGLIAYEYFVNDKNLKDALIETMKPW